MKRVALALVLSCGARTELDTLTSKDAANETGMVESGVVESGVVESGVVESGVVESGVADGGVDANGCGPASTVVGDIFGAVVVFGDGGSFPAGHYRVTYEDGCMKYSSTNTFGEMGWTVNAYAPTTPEQKNWKIISGATTNIVAPAPGTVGFLVDGGAFAAFDDCVAANHALAPTDFTFDGGTLAVWLNDNPYDDNVAGPQNRNPSWSLACEP